MIWQGGFDNFYRGDKVWQQERRRGKQLREQERKHPGSASVGNNPTLFKIKSKPIPIYTNNPI